MPGKKHDFTVTEIKAGTMVVLSAAALALFIGVVQGIRPPSTDVTFYAQFSNTGGLNRGADVRFGGAKVGRVEEISMDRDDQSLIRVKFTVKQGTPVNEKSTAAIGQTTLTAEKHLEISTGEKDALKLAAGAVIPAGPGGLFDQVGVVAKSVQETIESVTDLLGVKAAQEKESKGEGKFVSVAALTENVGQVLDSGKGFVKDVQDKVMDEEKGLPPILKKVQDVEDQAQGLVTSLQDMLAENRPDLRATVQGVRGGVENVQTMLRDAQPVIERVVKVSEQLDDLAASLQRILDNSEGLSADARALIQTNRPVLDDLLLDLRETVRHLKDFARTMAQQPQALIQGKNFEGRR